jgi:predicted transcriptional regulator
MRARLRLLASLRIVLSMGLLAPSLRGAATSEDLVTRVESCGMTCTVT